MSPSTDHWPLDERDWAIGLARRVLAPPPPPSPAPVEAVEAVLAVDPLVKPLDQEPPVPPEKEEP